MGTWVVTGASRGIGLELCRQLRERGEEVVAACRVATPELLGIGCSVAEGVEVTADDAARRIESALPAGGRIDVLVHNAGILRRDSLETVDPDVIREQFEVNALAPLRLTGALLPRLGEGSRIGLVSSRAGSIGDGPSGGMYGYRMSKAALNMAGANLARELRARGIHVVVLHPGFIRTDMTGGVGNEDAPVAAAGLIARLDELDAARSGRFFHANGEEVAW